MNKEEAIWFDHLDKQLEILTKPILELIKRLKDKGMID
jgi:hypothetical protein